MGISRRQAAVATLVAAVAVGFAGAEVLSCTHLHNAAESAGAQLLSGATVTDTVLGGMIKTPQALNGWADNVTYSAVVAGAAIEAEANGVDFRARIATEMRYTVTVAPMAQNAHGSGASFTIGDRAYTPSATAASGMLQIRGRATAPGAAIGPVPVALPFLPPNTTVEKTTVDTNAAVTVTMVARNVHWAR